MGHITMSFKEREQLKIFERLKRKEVTQKEAALKLGISIRWVRIKLKRYIAYGEAGLIHKNRGRTSPKQWSKKARGLAVNLLRNDWYGFGPTFASEQLLKRYGIRISKETLRKVMIQEGLWHSRKLKPKHRKRRERRSMFGMMAQFDGSPHNWFEGRGNPCTVLAFIDDATSAILWLEFAESESYQSVNQATMNNLAHNCRAMEYYVDHGKTFAVNLNNEEHEKLTQWERALGELEIKVIHARSPQAKGRVERANQTLQDRLINEMRLAGVCSIEEANRFVRESSFIKDYNNRFAVPAAEQGDAHKSVQGYNLDDILCLRETRTLANDYTITFNKRIFQLEASIRIRPGCKITVSTHLNGSISLSVDRTKLLFQELLSRPTKQPQPRKGRAYKSPSKPSENSKRWVSGKSPILRQESRVKPASPAVEAK